MISKYNNLSLPYDRILRYRIIPLKKQDTQWNIQVNESSESFKGIITVVYRFPRRESLIASKMKNFITQKLQKSISRLKGRCINYIRMDYKQKTCTKMR